MQHFNLFYKAVALLTLAGVFLSGSLLLGQQLKTKTLRVEGPGDIFMLRELGAVMSAAEEGLEIVMVMPPEQRIERYKDIDLRSGDIVMMLNGKRVKDCKSATELYEKLAVGDEIKLGIKRENEMLIETMVKADSDDLPQTMMVMQGPEDDNGVATTLLDAGLVLKNDKGKLSIDYVIDEMMEKYTGNRPQKGDIIVNLQGIDLDDPEQLIDIYSGINAGEKVEMIVRRTGKDIPVTFTKAGCGAAKPVIIKK